MKKRVIYLIIAVTLINLTVLGTIIYQRLLSTEECSRQKLRGAKFKQVKRGLALTKTQIERFEEIRYEFHTKVDTLNWTLEEINQQLLQEIWQPRPDNARIDTMLNRISRLQRASQHLVIRHFYQFKEVLTAEQWQRFYDIVTECFPAMPGRRIKNANCGDTQ